MRIENTDRVPPVLLLNQYYPPDTAATGRLAGSVAARLADRGHDVTAVVGQPSYLADAPPAPARATEHGVDVRRVSVGSSKGRESLATRVIGYLRFLSGSFVKGLRQRPEVVITFDNPPVLPLISLIIARMRRVPMVYVVADIHPEIVMATGFVSIPRPLVRAINAVHRLVLRRSAVVVTLGAGMAETLERKGAPRASLRVVTPWAEPELAVRDRDLVRRRELGVRDDQLLVGYAGNMGVMHPLEALFDAVRNLGRSDIAVRLAGDGVRREHWERVAAPLPEVGFVPYQHGEAFASFLAACDLLVVPLAAGMEALAIPSRTFTFLAAGRPVVGLLAPGSDVGRLITETGCGWLASDAASLTVILERLLADRSAVDSAAAAARGAFEQRFRREAITDRYVDIVEALLV